MQLNTILSTYLHPKGQINKKEFLTATIFSVFCLILITFVSSVMSISKQISKLFIGAPEVPEERFGVMGLIDLFAGDELSTRGTEFFQIDYLLCFFAIYVVFIAIVKYSRRLEYSQIKQYLLATLAALTLPILPTLFIDAVPFNIFYPESGSSYTYGYLFVQLYTPIRAYVAIIMAMVGVGVLAYLIRQNDSKEAVEDEVKNVINILVEILKIAAFGAIILLVAAFSSAASFAAFIKETVNILFAGTVLFYLIKRFGKNNTSTFATKSLIVTAIVIIINIAINCIPNDLFIVKHIGLSLISLMNIALSVYLVISVVNLLLGKIDMKNLEAKDSPFSNHFISLLIWSKGLISSIDFRAMLVFIFLLMYSTVSLGSEDMVILTRMEAIEMMFPYISNPFKGMAIFAFTYCIVNICTKRALAKGLTVRAGIVQGVVVSLVFCLIYNMVNSSDIPLAVKYYGDGGLIWILALLTLAALSIILYLSIRDNYDRENEMFGDDSYGLSTTSYLLKIVNVVVVLFIAVFVLILLMEKTRSYSSMPYVILGITICIALYFIYLFAQRVQNTSLSASKVVLILIGLNLACIGVAYVFSCSYTVFIWQIVNMAPLVFFLWPTESLHFFPDSEEEKTEKVEAVE